MKYFGTIKIELTNKATNNPKIFKIRKEMFMISGVVLLVCTIVRTTDKISIAKISSTMAAPKISLASFFCLFPIDDKTWIDIAILLAVNAVTIKSISSSSNPYKENTK